MSISAQQVRDLREGVQKMGTEWSALCRGYGLNDKTMEPEALFRMLLTFLDAMERGVTAEQVQWATHAAQRHGIQVGMFLMWGYDGETEDDIAATVEHVKKANPDIFFTTVAYPIKNTAYFEKVADRVVLDKPWEEAGDRDYKIRGRHSRAYYKQADRWLRSDVEAHRLRQSDPRRSAELRQEAVLARQALAAARTEVEV